MNRHHGPAAALRSDEEHLCQLAEIPPPNRVDLPHAVLLPAVQCNFEGGFFSPRICQLLGWYTYTIPSFEHFLSRLTVTDPNL